MSLNHFGPTKRRLLIALAALYLFATRDAVAQNPEEIPYLQRLRAVEVGGMVNSVLTDCHASQLAVILNQPSAGMNNVGYEFAYWGQPARVSDYWIEFNRALFDTHRTRKIDALGEGAITHNVAGNDDYVDFGSAIVDAIQDSSGLTGSDMLCAWVRFGALTIRELTHRFQIRGNGPFNTLTDCDAERDAECMALKFIDAFIDDLESSPTIPHTTIAAVEDAEIRRSMSYFGMTDGDVSTLHACVVRYRGWIAARKSFYLENPLNVGNSWAAFYSPINAPTGMFCEAVTPGGAAVILEDLNGTQKSYPAPPGYVVVNEKVFTNSNTLKPTLVVVLANTTVVPGSTFTGDLFRLVYVDGDCDGFPDCTPFGSSTPVRMTLIPVSTARTTYSVPVYVALDLPLAGSPTTTLDLATIVDPVYGFIITQRFLANGGITSPLNVATSNLVQSNGGFEFFHSIRSTTPGQIRITFMSEPRARATGETTARAFDGTLSNALVMQPSVATVAQSRAPRNAPNTSLVRAGDTGPVRLFGNPGQLVTLRSVGQGGSTVLASGVVGAGGLTSPLSIAAPIAPNDIVEASTASTGAIALFTPSEGTPLSCGGADLDNDGLMDRADVVVSPNRLHVSRGLSGGAMQHSFEQAFERSRVGPIMAISPTGLSIASTDGTPNVSFTRIAGQSVALFAGQPRDFNNDGNLTEAAVVWRGNADANFKIQMITNVNGPTPTVTQTIQLPVGFSPSFVEIVDNDQDGDLDVIIPETSGGQAVVSNNGSGSLAVTELCMGPGGLGQRGIAGTNLFDITGAINGNGNVPGDIADPFGPHTATVASGTNFTMSFDGTPNMPFLLLGSPHLVVGSVVLGSPIVENQIDIADCNLNDIIVVFDPNMPVLGNFFNTGSTGVASFSLPASTPFEISLQAAIFTGGPDIIAMTNAIRLKIN